MNEIHQRFRKAFGNAILTLADGTKNKGVQATPETKEQSLQIEVPTTESTTLTTVSATTGTEPADVQTQISRVKVISTEADTQHFNSCHELKDAATDPSNAHVELQTAFSLNAFAQENDSEYQRKKCIPLLFHTTCVCVIVVKISRRSIQQNRRSLGYTVPVNPYKML